MRIGIDVMGGDFYPHAPIAGTLLARQELPDTELVLIGQESVILDTLRSQGAEPDGFRIVHAEQVVSMHDHAAAALRNAPNSSMMAGIQMVKAGKLDAFLSAGNTGALMGASVIGLGLLDGILRPTVGSLFPNTKGRPMFICDVGANVDVKPEVLVQFGQIASVYMEAVLGVPNPKVCLLNIGEEESKGNQAAQAAFKLMQADPTLNFIGNMEGRDISCAKADIFVCDGFAGNILLKYAESLYDFLKAKLGPNDPDAEAFNPDNVGGLPFLGVKGNVLVGHGNSSAEAMKNMIMRAKELVDGQLIEKLKVRFESSEITAA